MAAALFRTPPSVTRGSDGPPSFIGADWRPGSRFQPTTVAVVRGNFGTLGSAAGWHRFLPWVGGRVQGDNPHNPEWNSMPPGTLYNAAVLDSTQLAAYLASNRRAVYGSPMNYTPPNLGTLANLRR